MKRIVSLVIILVMMFTINAYAINDIISGADSFISTSSSLPVDQSALVQVIKTLTNVGLVIGTIVAIAVGIIIAMKFMMEGAEGKADLKTALTPYVIGVAILFGAYGIWVVVINIFTSVFQ